MPSSETCKTRLFSTLYVDAFKSERYKALPVTAFLSLGLILYIFKIAVLLKIVVPRRGRSYSSTAFTIKDALSAECIRAESQHFDKLTSYSTIVNRGGFPTKKSSCAALKDLRERKKIVHLTWNLEVRHSSRKAKEAFS